MQVCLRYKRPAGAEVGLCIRDRAFFSPPGDNDVML